MNNTMSDNIDMTTHIFFMQKALEQAHIAQSIGEVPVGAVLVCNNEIIGYGHNQCITKNDPSLHAEMVAIRHAAEALQNYRLLDTTMYVTLEPCAMCAGLMVHARVKKVIFGTKDSKTGAAGSVIDLLQHEYVNHKVEVLSGVLQEECSRCLSDFFAQRRKQIKLKKQAKNKSHLNT